MPQRDDKVLVYFGRIPEETWNRLVNEPGLTPGAILERAIALLARTHAAGKPIVYPPSLRAKEGIIKQVWLTPAAARTVTQIAESHRIRRTPVIRAALDLYWNRPSD